MHVSKGEGLQQWSARTAQAWLVVLQPTRARAASHCFDWHWCHRGGRRETIGAKTRHTQSESETVVLVPNTETVVRTAVLNAECRSAIVAPSMSIAAWQAAACLVVVRRASSLSAVD
jgi:hypothetical protein